MKCRRGYSGNCSWQLSRICQKRGEFGFVWLFSIIAGVVILLLAIYGAVKTGDTTRVQSDAGIAKKLTILTDPLEAGFTSATFGSIKFQQEIWVRNLCSDVGFGENSLSVKSSSNVGQKYTDVSVSTSINEKYIFSPEQSTGTIYYVLSKPFNFPYKVSDYIILLSDQTNYCFVSPPESVEDELRSSLKVPVIAFENCSTSSEHIQVCFGDENCDISVIPNCESCQNLYDTGAVKFRDGRVVNYVGNLLYPAIFSSRSVYECNVNRLLYRGSTIGQILGRKAALMNARGCKTNLENDLYSWSNVLQDATVNDIISLYPDAVSLGDAAKWEVCNVW